MSFPDEPVGNAIDLEVGNGGVESPFSIVGKFEPFFEMRLCDIVPFEVVSLIN